MRLTFYGAAGEVTGSCTLVETDGARLLVDCGMFQGSKFSEDDNYTAFPFDPATIDAVLLTHAHLDHTGRVPKLVAHGFRGPIISTKPTLALADIILNDTLEVMKYHEKKMRHPMLFTASDLERTRQTFQGISYGEPIAVVSGITATFSDAGHILGSSHIQINADGRKIVFSGDLGNVDTPILRPPDARPDADILILETTYGAHRHEDRVTRTHLLQEAIIRTIGEGGTLLIPAFAIERIQEILYELNGLVQAGKLPAVPLYLDSPLAIRATEIFRKFSDYYDEEAMHRYMNGDDLFDFPGLTMTPSRDESRAINSTPPPKVIIAGAGMMTGGRVLHHAMRVLPDPKSTLLIVGYQAERTLGRQLLDGARRVRIYDESVPVRCRIQKIGGYSAHADRDGLIAWAAGAGSPPARIFLTHGESDGRATIAKEFNNTYHVTAELPERGQSYAV